MPALTSDVAAILVIVAAYLLLVLGVGQYAASKTGDSREEYLMASRSFGTVILLAALFATNMSAVVMVGAPGLAYQIGANAFGYFVGLFALLFPVLMMTAGHRIWVAGKKFGHVTPSQIVNHRYGSKYLGLLTMLLLTFWTVPYLLLGIQGGGIVFEGLTNGVVPYWAGGLVVAAVVFAYVYTGGMRGTGWTNAFQGTVFVLILLAFGILIPLRLGGFQAATQAALDAAPPVVNRAGIPPLTPKAYLTAGLAVPLGGFMFPHLFIRYMTGKSERNLQRTAVVYPIAVALAWIPAVLIGFWAIGQIPQLGNPDFALPAMIQALFPTWVVGIALAGILAALMSSLDGQVLTLGTMFTEDVMTPFFDITERYEVIWTRVFVVLVLLAAWVASLFTRESIIDTAVFAFSGYALLFFPIVGGLYSERLNKYAAGTGMVFGFLGHWAFQFGMLPESWTFGFAQFFPVLLVQIVLMAVVTAFTSPPPEERTEAYKDAFDGIW